jgi:hypothetical protein
MHAYTTTQAHYLSRGRRIFRPLLSERAPAGPSWRAGVGGGAPTVQRSPAATSVRSRRFGLRVSAINCREGYVGLVMCVRRPRNRSARLHFPRLFFARENSQFQARPKCIDDMLPGLGFRFGGIVPGDCIDDGLMFLKGLMRPVWRHQGRSM